MLRKPALDCLAALIPGRHRLLEPFPHGPAADDPASNKLLMVMEYAEGGTVMLGDQGSQNTKHPLSEGVARKYFRDVIKVWPCCCAMDALVGSGLW